MIHHDFEIIFPPEQLQKPQFKNWNLRTIVNDKIFKVLRFRGTIQRDVEWDVKVDLYFYREPEETEKDEIKQLVPAVPARNGLSEMYPEPVEQDYEYKEPIDQPIVPSPAIVPSTATAASSDWATQAQEEWGATNTQPSNWAAATTEWH